MNNFLGHSQDQMLTAATAVAAGGGLLVGSLFGVAKTAIAAGARGPFSLTGKFALPKDGAAIVEGAKVYWDAANKRVTATAAGNTLIGACTFAAAAGDATAHVRLNGVTAG